MKPRKTTEREKRDLRFLNLRITKQRRCLLGEIGNGKCELRKWWLSKVLGNEMVRIWVKFLAKNGGKIVGFVGLI